MESIQSRKPSKSYVIFLKEKWLQFKIKTLSQYGSLPFQDYMKFIRFCEKVSTEDRAKMAEFYMHNMILIDLNFWDPNSRFGDMQLMALASLLTREETRA